MECIRCFCALYSALLHHRVEMVMHASAQKVKQDDAARKLELAARELTASVLRIVRGTGVPEQLRSALPTWCSNFAGDSRSWSSSTTTPHRYRTASWRPESCVPNWLANSQRQVMSVARAVAPPTRGSGLDARRTIGSISPCRYSARATLMLGSGCASAKSSRASR